MNVMAAPHDQYTHGHDEAVLRSHRWRTAENSCAYLLPHLTPDMAILDIGCGPGTITLDLGARVPHGAVVGLDRSDVAVAVAQQSAVDAEVSNVTFAIGDVYGLDAADDTYDVVHAHQVLQHLSDPVAALIEMRRVCRPGGIVAARDADYGAFTWSPADTRLDDWLALYRSVARGNHAEPDAGRALLAWAHAAGFDDVAAGGSVWVFAEPSDRQWWGGLWADRVSGTDLADQAVARQLATPGDLDAMAEAFRAWADHADGWFSVLHGEILARVPVVSGRI